MYLPVTQSYSVKIFEEKATAVYQKKTFLAADYSFSERSVSGPFIVPKRRFQSKYGKIRTRKNSIVIHFLRSDLVKSEAMNQRQH